MNQSDPGIKSDPVALLFHRSVAFCGVSFCCPAPFPSPQGSPMRTSSADWSPAQVSHSPVESLRQCHKQCGRSFVPGSKYQKGWVFAALRTYCLKCSVILHKFYPTFCFVALPPSIPFTASDLATSVLLSGFYPNGRQYICRFYHQSGQ